MSEMSTRWGWFLGIAIGSAYAFSANCALAQITPDGTLPNNSRVTTQDNMRIIDGGTQAGGNLFHSFKEFSVPTGGTAFFNNAQGIQNIISRVTGGSVSNIDGLIRANGTANLFLINPNGIVFGRNASLNIGGSFVASTASSLKFADGSEFSATAAQSTPLLTISVPMGLQYGANPGSIQVQGDRQGLRSTTELIDTTSGLWVQPNQTLALVGGDVSLEGATLKTAGGRIELGSVGHNSLVSLTPINKGFALGYDTVQNFGNIQLSQQVAVDASGAGGGDIQVMGRRVTLTNGSQIKASTLGAEQGGNLVVNAQDSVQLIGISADSQFPTGLFANAYPSATGAAGELTINTRELLVRDGGRVSASTYGAGNAGNLTVRADSVQLIGASSNGRSRSSLLTDAHRDSTGAAGNLTVNTRELLVQNGAFVSARTFGAGNAGNLTVNADSVQLTGNSAAGAASALVATSEQGATGAAGDLMINTSKLSLQDGAQVSAGTWGPGKGGNLTVKADSVQVIGIGTSSASSLNTNAFLTATGAAGDLTINTRELLVRDGGRVSASTYGAGNGGNLTINTRELLVRDGGRVSASTYGAGNGGNLTVTADSVQLIGASSNGFRSSLLTETSKNSTGAAGNMTINTRELLAQNGAFVGARTFGAGNAGNLTVNADSVQLTGNSPSGDASALIATSEKGATGAAGNLTINTSKLSLQDGAQVSAGTWGPLKGGNLTVRADSVQVIGGTSDLRSSLNTQAFATATGAAGDLSINTRELLVRDGGEVSASTYGAGKGGNIDITAGSLFITNGGLLNASTFGQGNAGSVNIDARDIVSFDRESAVFSSVEANVIGNNGNINRTGGDINIKTGSLFVTDGAQLFARTLGRGDAGNVNIDARDTVSFDGVGSNRFSSAAFSTVDPNAVGKGGNINISTGTLSVKNGALLAASTRERGTGNAGSVNINARDTVSFDGVGSNGFPSAAASTVEIGAVGNGSGINITTGSLFLANGAQLSASTSGQGDGGNIIINANTFSAVNGGQVLTTSRSSGKAGNITLDVTDSVTLAGSDRNYFTRPALDPQYREIVVGGAGPNSGLFANTSETSTNRGGDLSITTRQLNLQDGAQVNVSSQGLANAGNLDIKANFIRLENQGQLTASTAAGTGGNITLSDLNLLLMRSRSLISAEALNDATGGNITINAPDGFIVTNKRENNDIVAKAAQGRGGQIEIRATGIYGFENYDRNRGNRYFSNISDINASSEAGSQLDGTVEINTPDIDPNSGLINLPSVPVDTEVAQSCTAGGTVAKSQFTVTGRGGLPPNPGEALNTDAVQVNLITLKPSSDNRNSPTVTSKTTTAVPERIVEATGWIINKKGEVVLIANAPTATPHSPSFNPASCRAS